MQLTLSILNKNSVWPKYRCKKYYNKTGRKFTERKWQETFGTDIGDRFCNCEIRKTAKTRLKDLLHKWRDCELNMFARFRISMRDHQSSPVTLDDTIIEKREQFHISKHSEKKNTTILDRYTKQLRYVRSFLKMQKKLL